MKIKIIKISAFFFICFILLGILWYRTHLPYYSVYEKSYNLDTVIESKEDSINKKNIDELPVEFPKRVEREVSEDFSYNADIIVGDKFDKNQFYQCTAVLRKPDPQKWMDFFQVDSENWEISEKETGGTRHGGLKKEIDCFSKTGDVLYIGWDNVLYAVDDMKYINHTFNQNLYSPTKNNDLFSKDSDLPFENREENWNYLKENLSKLDIFLDESVVISVYSLDLNTLQEQEEVRFLDGNFRAEEKNPLWNSRDEGYYYFLMQEYQGLPIFKYESTAKWEKEDDRTTSAIEIYCTEAGIRRIWLEYWFDFQKTDQKISLAPFDKIMETIDKKYGSVKQDYEMIVTECRLMLYPKNIGKEKLEVLPVWLCTIESDDPYFKTIYLSIHAVTAEEVYEMEYYT